MTLLTAPAAPRPIEAPVTEGTSMLLHEALARSRQREAEEAARRYRLVRQARLAARRHRPGLLRAVLTPFRRCARLRAAAVRRAYRA